MQSNDLERRCLCGYLATDPRDLWEHIDASLEPDDPPTGSQTHRPVR